MKRKLIDFRGYVILSLFAIALIELINPFGFMPHRVKYVAVPQVDSIPYAVHDTVTADSLVEVAVPYKVEVPVEVRVPVPATVDTNEILRVYYAKNPYKNVLTLPNGLGTITLNDTISQNKVTNRAFTANIKQKVINDTIFTKEPFKNKLYFGIDAKLDKPNVINLIGIGLLFQTKDDHIYKLGIGVSNKIDGTNGTTGTLVPYIGGGVYWQIKKRK
jgi:hypothetical protein